MARYEATYGQDLSIDRRDAYEFLPLGRMALINQGVDMVLSGNLT